MPKQTHENHRNAASSPPAEGPETPVQRASGVLRKGASSSWLLPFGLLIIAIVVVPLQILDDHGLPRYQQLRDQLADVQDENRSLRNEAASLRDEVERLRTDPSAVETVARDDLGMVREGEIVFQFDGD